LVVRDGCETSRKPDGPLDDRRTYMMDPFVSRLARFAIGAALLIASVVLRVSLRQQAVPPPPAVGVATSMESGPSPSVPSPLSTISGAARPMAPRVPPRPPVADEPPLRPDRERQLQARLVRSTVLIVRPAVLGMAVGTGTLIDKTNRLVLTNYHVAGDGERLSVYFPMYEGGTLLTDFKRYVQSAAGRARAVPGRGVLRIPEHDLALVQLDRIPDAATPLPLATGRPRPGDRVYSLGNASDAGKLNLLWTLTSGSLRRVTHQRIRTGLRVGETPLAMDADFLLTSSPIAPGDSGGPMVNRCGELIGVTQGVLTGADRLAIYIDRSEVTRALEQYVARNLITLDLAHGPALEVADKSPAGRR
jgi:S1-C subfamily serine protease